MGSSIAAFTPHARQMVSVAAKLVPSYALTPLEQMAETGCGEGGDCFLIFYGCDGAPVVKYAWTAPFTCSASADCECCGGTIEWEYHNGRHECDGRISHVGPHFDEAESRRARVRIAAAAADYANSMAAFREKEERDEKEKKEKKEKEEKEGKEGKEGKEL